MREVGKVLRLEEEVAVVEIPRSEACRNCRGCYFGAERDKMLAEARNPLRAKEGDQVVLELESQRFMAAAFVIYLVPLVFLIVGYFVGDAVGGLMNIEGSSVGIIFSLALFAFAYVVIALIDRRAQQSGRFDPQIVEVVKGSTVGDESAAK